MPIPANPYGRYRASQLALSDQDPVATWPDEGSGGNDLVQATGAAQPTFLADAFLGLPCVRFDGDGDFMEAPYPQALSQPTTIVLMYRSHYSIGTMTHFDSVDSGDRQTIKFNNRDWLIYAGGSSVELGPGIWNDDTPKLIEAWFASNNAGIAVDGVTVDTTSNAGSDGLGGLTVGARIGGGSEWHEMDLVELLVYDRLLDAGERDDLADYYQETYLGVAGDPEIAASVSATAAVTATAEVEGAPTDPQVVEISARVGVRRSEVPPPGGAAVLVENWGGYPSTVFGNPEGLDARRTWTQGRIFTADRSWAGWQNAGDGIAMCGSGTPGTNASHSLLDPRDHWTAILDDDLGADDHYARVTVEQLSSTPNHYGPMVRVSADESGALTGYYLQCRPGNQHVRIQRIVDGGFDSVIGTSAPHVHTVGDVYELRINGDRLTVRINGDLVIDATDDQVTTGRQVGLSASTSSSQAVRVTGFVAGPLDDEGAPVDGAEHPPIPAVQFAWCGIPVDGVAPIAVSTRNVGSIRVVVADDDQLANVVYTSPYEEPDDLGLVQFRATGLAAGTEHWYALQLPGAQQIGPVRRFRTPPTGQASFTWVMAGDASSRNPSSVEPWYRMVHTSDSPTYERIAARDPAFFVFAGDRHYRDYNTTDPLDHLRGHRDIWVNPRAQTLFDAMAVSQMWDDHDFTGDSADASAAGRDTAVDVWRRAVPTEGYLLGDPLDPVGHTFTWGRVRFIVMDHRSAKASGTVVGSGQLAEILELIENAPEELLVLSVGIPWIANSSSDNWLDASSERQTIANAIEQHRPGRVIIVHADAHMLAADDGTNSQYATGDPGPGPWLFCCAPLQSGFSLKGGPYSEGTIPASDDGAGQQYATFDVDDQGSQIVVTWTGWVVDGDVDEEDVITRQVIVPVGGD